MPTSTGQTRLPSARCHGNTLASRPKRRRNFDAGPSARVTHAFARARANAGLAAVPRGTFSSRAIALLGRSQPIELGEGKEGEAGRRTISGMSAKITSRASARGVYRGDHRSF